MNKYLAINFDELFTQGERLKSLVFPESEITTDAIFQVAE